MQAMTQAPAEMLAGRQLDGGWTVIGRIYRNDQATGGHFSVGYHVRHESGKEGFLKALDFSECFLDQDPPRALELATTAFNFERRILRNCRDKRLSRIASAITDGTIFIPGTNYPVSYIILEKADGDIRNFFDLEGSITHAWMLRSLHHVATGLLQLHSQRIAHQDLKPSNVLVFGGGGTKVGDLGRAADGDQTGPYDGLGIAGDKTYAPPELLYGQVDPDWTKRRLGCDLYLFGSLMFFFFGRGNVTALILSHLSEDLRPGVWADDYQTALPHVYSAFDAVMQDFLSDLETRKTLNSGEIVQLVRYLCDPDPGRRGYPRSRPAAQYSMERFVSRLDFLASKAELGVTK